MMKIGKGCDNWQKTINHRTVPLIDKFSEFNDFLGPFDAHSFYNDYGCFTILHAVQRNEIEYYISHEFSNSKKILFEMKISEQVFKIMKQLRVNPLNLFKRDNTLVAKFIVDEINKKGEFFGIKVERTPIRGRFSD